MHLTAPSNNQKMTVPSSEGATFSLSKTNYFWHISHMLHCFQTQMFSQQFKSISILLTAFSYNIYILVYVVNMGNSTTLPAENEKYP